MFGIPLIDYFYICLAEEGLFRMIPLEFLVEKRPLLAFLLATVPYSLLHFLKFNTLVVLLCFFLGILNSLIYYNTKRPLGYIYCVLTHYFLGGLAYYFGLIK